MTDTAESLLREVVQAHPELYEIRYSLALLLVENGHPEEAATHLSAAETHLPGRHRISYNLGLLYQQLERFGDAEAALRRALGVAPDHAEYLYALAVFYINQNRTDEARQAVETLVEKHPSLPAAQELRAYIDRHLKP